ncbi:four helix bundle protein [Clostridium estertheticum]|uniref:four helix bundle protein n=1 Tax=Clostridium estertheticum TaxID=238834 RepID=UPI0013E94CDC|nr:four helix bundle protein [Clostridium estertheticum]MBZ9689378.1 four helix bundle protein [Clostridium estertheticum]
MNTYEKIYYENFRKKFAYVKTLELIEKINEIVEKCNTEKNRIVQKKAIKIATETAQAIGSILSETRRDFHYKLAIRLTYEFMKDIEDMGTTKEYKYENVKEILNKALEVIKLLRTYRKNLRIKENEIMKTVDVGDKLDIKNIQMELDKIKDFRDLSAYKIIMDFFKILYPILAKLPEYEQYSVFSQTQRASESIVANIAEGNGRGAFGYKKVEANFYSISFGSCTETQCWLDVLKLKGYIDLQEHYQMDNLLEQIKKLLISYIKRLIGEVA